MSGVISAIWAGKVSTFAEAFLFRGALENRLVANQAKQVGFPCEVSCCEGASLYRLWRADAEEDLEGREKSWCTQETRAKAI